MKRKKFPHVSRTTIKKKVYWRFRRTGYSTHYFKSPYGSKEFEQEYAACLSAEPMRVGADRIKAGSVSDAVSRYYGSNAFLDLRPTTQTVYRGVLERLRTEFGNDPIKRFDAERIDRLMTAMRHKPHAAARLRKLLHQLFIVARRAHLVPSGFDPVKDTRPPKADTKGYHSWTEDELDAFEAKHPLGSKQRLAFALLLYGAQRSGDVRLMTRKTIEGGRIILDQSKTSNAVDVPVVEPLREALDAGPLGGVTLLETKSGEPFNAKVFYNFFKKACVAAGIPHCSAHGLRKAAARRCRVAECSDEEGMAITGHKTVKEYRRYAGTAGTGHLADAAMAKVLAIRKEKLATASSQPTEKAK